MAASTTVELPVEVTAPVCDALPMRSNRRRHIDSRSGHALEILGHAIEYLADEYAHQGRSLSAGDGQVRAIQLLMALNRQIYNECPEVPTFAERCLSFLRTYRR